MENAKPHYTGFLRSPAWFIIAVNSAPDINQLHKRI